MIAQFYAASITFQLLLLLFIFARIFIESFVQRRNVKLRTTVLILFSTVWLSEGIEYDTKFSRDYTKEHTLVSVKVLPRAPEGQSAIMKATPIYKLKEQLSNGSYKDFTVKNKVSLYGDKTLKDEGKYIQVFTCDTLDINYKYLMFTLWNKTLEDCKYVRQEIVIPDDDIVREFEI